MVIVETVEMIKECKLVGKSKNTNLKKNYTEREKEAIALFRTDSILFKEVNWKKFG
jgi:hypothetical protein